MARTVGISGSYGGLNLGDEAILTAICAQLRAAVRGVELVVFSRDRHHTAAHHDVDRVVGAREALRDELVNEVARLDLLLLGGGGILFDREAESYLHVPRIAQERGVPTATYAIGVGPLQRPRERQAVAEVLDAMAALTVRDTRTKRLLEEIGVEREIVVTADPALLLEPVDFPEEDLGREGVHKGRPLVGMSIREPGAPADDRARNNYHRLLAHAADFIVDRFDADVLFVPMERQDIRHGHRVIAEMAFVDRAAILRGDYTPGQVLGLMRHLDLAVGMRLHFLIFAGLAQVPVLALPYASKVRSFLEDLGIDPPSEVERHAGALLASIDRLWDLRDAQSDLLRDRVPKLQERARQNALTIMALLGDAAAQTA